VELPAQPTQMVPRGELFDGSSDGRLGDGVEFGGKPDFETC
jgi:hypothetical protein